MTQPGLDLTLLRSLTPGRRDTHALVDRIRTHLDAHDGYVSLSGGKDSLVVLDLALRADPNVPVCFFDSGLEYPETITYLDTLETHYGITIHTYPADPPLLDLLVECGAWDHTAPTRRTTAASTALIDRPADQAHADHGDGLLWGLRAQESPQRAGLFARALRHPCTCCTTASRHRERHGGTTTAQGGRRVGYSPVWDWSTDEVMGWIAREQLPLNPVYGKFAALGAPVTAHRVAPLLDGGHLAYGRATWLKAGWPQLWTQLVDVLPRLATYA